MIKHVAFNTYLSICTFQMVRGCLLEGQIFIRFIIVMPFKKIITLVTMILIFTLGHKIGTSLLVQLK